MATNKKIEISIRVYVEDTDCYGIVQHAKFINFLERARTDWLINIDMDLRKCTEYDIYLPVRSINIVYLRPARLNDLLNVSAELIEARGSSMLIQQKITRQDQAQLTTICEAEVKLVCTNKNLQLIPIPSLLMEKFT